MNVLEKIELLLEKNHLNKKQLSRESEIPYTTIVNLFNRDPGSMNLSTFKRLCDFFKVDMTSMAYDELEIKPYDPYVMYTTEHERKVILRYRASDYIDQTSIDRTLGVEPEESELETSKLSGSPKSADASKRRA